MKYSVETGAGFAMAVLCVLTGLQTAEAVYWMEILKVAELAFSNINHAWYLLEPKLKPGSPYYQEKNNPEDYLVRDQPMFYVKSEEESLLARINEINRKISSIEESMRIHEENIVRKLQLIPREIMTEMKVNQVLDLIRDIEARYETFTNYVELGTEDPTDDKPRLDRLTMENFALFTVSPSSDSPLSVLSKLHNLLIPHMDSDRLLGTKSFYYTFKDYLNAFDARLDVGKTKESPVDEFVGTNTSDVRERRGSKSGGRDCVRRKHPVA
ncbi:Hypothetical protein NTJ_09527 [Nesidiocoris tenuis]|uniref:Uncharacterized protein n=1 Tax=Nesidiocoris tenuis TaxID=355587 RepID=A0ABN7AX00_9HEMI|nr:Hypothetical protein NTJ_09527 [Nesidiocoris tenuis]